MFRVGFANSHEQLALSRQVDRHRPVAPEHETDAAFHLNLIEQPLDQLITFSREATARQNGKGEHGQADQKADKSIPNTMRTARKHVCLLTLVGGGKTHRLVFSQISIHIAASHKVIFWWLLLTANP